MSGCPGDKIKVVPRGLCWLMTDSRSPPPLVTHLKQSKVAAASSLCVLICALLIKPNLLVGRDKMFAVCS